MSSPADQEPSATAQPQKKTTKNASSGSGGRTSKAVHFSLQAKGGVGKTLSASLVAQYLTEMGRQPLCFDTDPLNESFVRIKALGATEVPLLKNDAINAHAVDALVERILTTDAEIVVDNGAASFVPMSTYLVENNIAELIESAGKRMVIHTVIVGGGNTLDTAKGLEAILVNFPQSVQVVVWINDYFGAVEEGGSFATWPIYDRYRDRIAGVVHLKQQSQQFGLNIGQMLERKLTFAEALADTAAFMTVPRQRLTMYRRAIWEQLAAVI
jgi:hypothetical protein